MSPRSTSDISACLLTPPGRGAVATIGLRGELDWIDACFSPANGQPIQKQLIDRICFGTWKAPATEVAEEVVVIRTEAVAAELHCHGGVAAVDRILGDVIRAGGQVIESQSWRERELGLVHVECLESLQRASTRKAAHHLLRQCTLLPLNWQMLDKVSDSDRLSLLQTMLDWSEFGVHLTVPWKVVLCGRPNVGKSSLINALVGYTRSVVFDQPGTTRDVVAVETAFDGWPVELSDTAGLRDTDEELESAGILRARDRIQAADVVVIVLDATAELTSEDQKLIDSFPEAVLVWNKIDLASLPRGTLSAAKNSLQVSAADGTGVSAFINAIVAKIVPKEPPVEMAFPVTRTQQSRLQLMRDRLQQTGRG